MPGHGGQRFRCRTAKEIVGRQDRPSPVVGGFDDSEALVLFKWAVRKFMSVSGYGLHEM